MKIEYQPIGIIHSPFTSVQGMPIQPVAAQGVVGHVEVFPTFRDGLRDLSGFSHVTLIYHLHQSQGYSLRLTPFLDTAERGVFATRAPLRPNPIGMSVVRLISVEDCTLRVENLDILDGTPLLDIKPHVPEFDHHPADRIGWIGQAKARARETRADDRFQAK